jgi:predicted nucleic acid-binding protein
VAARLSFDTSFLVDFQREWTKGDHDGAAHRFLRQSPDAEMFVSAVALGEFAEGFPGVEHPTMRMIRERYVLLPVDEEAALVYAGVARDLRSRGSLIGANDLWIGAVSLRFRLPIVTRNRDHFERIEGLEVLGY